MISVSLPPTDAPVKTPHRRKAVQHLSSSSPSLLCKTKGQVRSAAGPHPSSQAEMATLFLHHPQLRRARSWGIHTEGFPSCANLSLPAHNRSSWQDDHSKCRPQAQGSPCPSALIFYERRDSKCETDSSQLQHMTSPCLRMMILSSSS